MSYSRIDLTGADVQSFLQRQCSQDISSGQPCYGAFLTPKAETIALVYLVRNEGIALPSARNDTLCHPERSEGFLCDYTIIIGSNHATTLKEHLEKFIILDDVVLTLHNDLGDIILPADFALVEFTPKQQLMKIVDVSKYVSFTKGCYPGQEVVAKWNNAGQRKRTERAQRYLDEALALNVGVGHCEEPQATKQSIGHSIGIATATSSPRNDDSVIELLRKSLKDDPQNEEAMEALGVMLARAQRYDEAIKVLQQLELINPQSIMAKANLSILYMKLGDKERAEQYKAEGTVLQFKKALKPL
jgi:folate-binding protein YgfZ